MKNKTNNVIRPLKRFGQNFLIDQNVARKMVEAASLTSQRSVLEIGPGRGALTALLAQAVKRVVAVEIDRGLCGILREDFGRADNVDVVCSDILKFDLKSYLIKNEIKKVTVVANLPYYITTPIIEYFVRHIQLIEDIYITVQKEVALRLTALPKTKIYGSLTCFVNYFCEPAILFQIGKGCFRPAPKIDSCFVRLKPYGSKKRPYRARSEELLLRVVRASFGQRRKQILNPLSKIFEKEDLQNISRQDFLTRRAEEFSLGDFVVLSNLIFDFLNKR